MRFRPVLGSARRRQRGPGRGPLRSAFSLPLEPLQCAVRSTCGRAWSEASHLPRPRVPRPSKAPRQCRCVEARTSTYLPVFRGRWFCHRPLSRSPLGIAKGREGRYGGVVPQVDERPLTSQSGNLAAPSGHSCDPSDNRLCFSSTVHFASEDKSCLCQRCSQPNGAPGVQDKDGRNRRQT
jgi:hypothetical protein